MSTPTLATKLYIPPPRPKVVLRPLLIKRLNEGLYGKLTLISAPAGFGKTTLVSQWVAGCERPVAWLSLDEGDNDPTRFLTYLVTALQSLALSEVAGIATNMGAGVLAMLQSPQPLPAEAILTSLLNEITTIPKDFVLVLDDYHVIEAQSVDKALVFLLDHLPPQMHLVITTREDPPLPLARLRVRSQLSELRVADLRFTLPEAADFLNQVMGLRLSAENIAALETRTEGWIAGLQLAALALQGMISLPGHQDATGFINSFTGSHHFVMDYLVEEVLHQQSESVQAFLLRTSILDRLCGPLCEAVLLTPSASGQETLEYLERANLLVVPLDDRREWYRYHHLFADVLQARLIKEQPNQVADLHLRASVWYEQNNFGADAIRHALAAQDFQRAADLIEPIRSVMRGMSFQSATWLGWVKALPDEFVRPRPVLIVDFAWELLFLGELEAAEARMRDADRLLEPTGGINIPSELPADRVGGTNDEDLRSLRASLAIAWAFHAQALGDSVGTVKHARRALTLVSETNYLMHGLANSLLGLACLTNGDLEIAYNTMAQAMASLRMSGNILFATSCTFVLADIRKAQGRLLAAISIYEQALQLATAQGEPVLPGTAELHIGLSALNHERGNVEAARQHLLKSEELGQRAALDTWPSPLYLAQARMREDQGDWDGALELLGEAERLYHRGPLPNVRPIAALKTRVWLRQGRLTEALAWVRERDLSVDDDLSYWQEFEHVTLARVLIAGYKNDGAEHSIHEAVGLLARLLKAAEEGGRTGSVIEILVLQALAHQAQGNILLALVPLERALALAEPEGYVHIFVGEGMPMVELLTKMKDGDGKAKVYIHTLLTALRKPKEVQPFGSASDKPSSLPLRTPQSLVEPLSPRELEVLQLIAQGLSNHEIGERLFLALNTIKGHNRKIFDKLQVQRRTEAVARGRELGLL